jgi:putative ABC transport system permease protein
MPLVAGNRNWMSLVAGINPDYLVAREWQVTDGRSFTGGEIGSGAKVAVVGSVIIEELFGGRSGIGEAFRIGSVPFTVIGVLGKKGLGAAGCSQDDVVFIPLSTAKSRVLGAVRGTTRDALDFISIKVSDAGAMPEVEGKIESLLGLLLIAVASVSLVVGGISIMNIMLVSVTERTREIGLRVAVGARRRDIRWQFLIEALTLALVGGLVGAFLGAAAAIAIALKAGWPVLISPWTIILACGFAGFVGISFGLYPAHRAARIDPIVALRFE